ncbi:MAG: hypothetical protein PIR02_15910 [Microbacterium enclense]
MKRGLVPAGLAVLVLALSGCVSVQTSEERVEVTPGASGTYSAGDTTVVVEPSEAPATPVEVSATPTPPTKATSVLTAIQLTVASYGVDVMADQIKAASDYACDQLAAGADADNIVALTGEIPEGANRDLVTAAKNDYCPIR